MKMNLPNKLTVLRLIMVPIFMVVMLIPSFVDLSERIIFAHFTIEEGKQQGE